MNEKREYERLDKIIGIQYTLSDGQVKHAMTRDISMGGISFLSDEEIPQATKFKVSTIASDDANLIEIAGTVVRCEKQTLGCIIAGRFDDLSSELETSLKKYIIEYKN